MRTHVSVCIGLVALLMPLIALLCCMGAKPSPHALQRASETVAHATDVQPRLDPCEPEAIESLDELDDDDASTAWALLASAATGLAGREPSLLDAPDVRGFGLLVSTGLGRGPPLG